MESGAYSVPLYGCLYLFVYDFFQFKYMYGKTLILNFPIKRGKDFIFGMNTFP